MGRRCNQAWQRWLSGIGFGLALWCTGLVGVADAASPITEFPLPAGDDLGTITAGPDGALWFTFSTVNPKLCTCPAGVTYDCTYIIIACRARNATHIIGRITTTGTVTEFPLPAGDDLGTITAGPDGALWFTALNHHIGRITTTGTVTEFPLPAGSNPDTITAGPDGALWFTEYGTSKIGRITTTGTVTEFPLPAGSNPDTITAGPDGALWFTEYGTSKIGRITTTGTVTEFNLPTPDSRPLGITAGPDGALWFTEYGTSKIGRITTTGTVTEFNLPTPDSRPLGITAGPDGALWFTEGFRNDFKYARGRIGRITTTGTVTEFPLPSPDDSPDAIAAGPDGALWFTVRGNPLRKIGRITADLAGIAEVSLSEAALCTGRTISYQATLTPGAKPTPVDVYLGAVLPDGVTHLSLIQEPSGGTAIALGPSTIPFQANVPLAQSVIRFSYTFEGFEPDGTYVSYARLTIAGRDPFVPENQLDEAVQSFRFTSGVVLSLSVSAGGSVTRSPAGTICGPGRYAFAPGTTVTLTAKSDYQFFIKDDFLGWGGDCAAVGRKDSRTHGTCTLVMTTNKSVSAIFDCPICHTYF